MQVRRYMAVQCIPYFEKRLIATVAIYPFFVGKRHHQVRLTLKMTGYGIGPAVTDNTLKIEGRYHGGNCHGSGSTGCKRHILCNTATRSAAKPSEQNDHIGPGKDSRQGVSIAVVPVIWTATGVE